jgi:drug/metabolite transporter (DMT)-like permease
MTENPYAPPTTLAPAPPRLSRSRSRMRRRNRVARILSLLFGPAVGVTAVVTGVVAGELTDSDAVGDWIGVLSAFAYGCLFVMLARSWRRTA